MLAISPDDLVLVLEPSSTRATGFPFPPWDADERDDAGSAASSCHRVGEVVAAGRLRCTSSRLHPGRRTVLTAPTSNGLAAGASLDACRARRALRADRARRDVDLLAEPAARPPSSTLPPRAGSSRDVIGTTAARASIVRAFVLPTDLPATVVMAVAFDDDPARPAHRSSGWAATRPRGCRREGDVRAVPGAAERGRTVPRQPAGGTAANATKTSGRSTTTAHSPAAVQRRDEFDFLVDADGVVGLDRAAAPVDGATPRRSSPSACGA